MDGVRSMDKVSRNRLADWVVGIGYSFTIEIVVIAEGLVRLTMYQTDDLGDGRWRIRHQHGDPLTETRVVAVDNLPFVPAHYWEP